MASEGRNNAEIVDAFDRGSTVETIRALLTTISQSIVIGVPGRWGGGKTTLFRLIEQANDADFPIIIPFDAWAAEHVDEPMLGLLAAVRDVAEKQAIAGKGAAQRKAAGLFARLAKRGTGLLRPMLKPFMLGGAGVVTAYATGSLEAAGMVGALAGEGFDRALSSVTEDVVDELDAVSQPREQFIKELETVVSEIEAPEHYNGAKLVFLVDELDRCKPDFALRVFERIKHFFGTRGVAFVVAYDAEYLESAASVVYGAKFDAARYFRRFIDMEVPVPPVSNSAVAEYYLNKLDFKSAARLYYPEFGKDFYEIAVEVARALGPGLSLRDCEQFMARVRTVLALSNGASVELDTLVPYALAIQFLSNERRDIREYRRSWLTKSLSNLSGAMGDSKPKEILAGALSVMTNPEREELRGYLSTSGYRVLTTEIIYREKFARFALQNGDLRDLVLKHIRVA